MLSAKKQVAFLAAYAECATITGAVKASGVAATTHYRWLSDPDYAARFAEAALAGAEALEAEARRRAVEGDAIYHYDKHGNLLWTEHRRSDLLLIFLLKGAMPQKYRERVEVEHSVVERAAKRLADEYDLDATEVLREAEAEIKRAT